MTEPWLLKRAKWLDAMCQRYSCLPSELMAEDADTLLQMQAVLSTVADKDGPTESMESNLANLSRAGLHG